MPYAFKANKVFAKNPDGDGYMSQTVITDKTTNDAIAEIQAAGSTQVANVNSAGSTQVANVNSAGTTQTTRVNTAGDSQVTAISNKATELQTLMNDADTTISKIDALDDIISGLRSLLDLVHPVGSIYISKDSTDPGDMFGGVWQPLKDRFLLTAGDTYHVGDADGGEAEHTLTIEEMPKHRHYPYGETESGNGNWRFPNIRDRSSVSGKMELVSGTGMYGFGSNSTWNDTAISAVTGNTGGNQPHNNMPPYTIVYAWERVQ